MLSPGGGLRGGATLLNLENRTAVITGAAGGIGRAIAEALARRGCNLALADIDEPALQQAASSLSAAGVRVSAHALDVSDASAVADLPGKVLGQHQQVELLVNNAGVALGGTFEQVAPADFDWLFGINFWGVVRMTRAFLPLLRTAGEARVVNLSSLFGLIAPPGQTAYVASKFAVRGFSESLRHELSGSSVGVTVVHPGGVNTAIARSARLYAGASPEIAARALKTAEAALTLPPATAGEIIVRAVERRRPRVLVGRDARIAAGIERLLPVSYWRLLRRMTPRAARPQ